MAADALARCPLCLWRVSVAIARWEECQEPVELAVVPLVIHPGTQGVFRGFEGRNAALGGRGVSSVEYQPSCRFRLACVLYAHVADRRPCRGTLTCYELKVEDSERGTRVDRHRKLAAKRSIHQILTKDFASERDFAPETDRTIEIVVRALGPPMEVTDGIARSFMWPWVIRTAPTGKEVPWQVINTQSARAALTALSVVASSLHH